MNLVERWFMKTPEGEIIDGPYKNKKEFDRELALYIKTYKYVPVVKKELVDADKFTRTEQYGTGGYETGYGRRGRSRALRAS